MNLRPATPADLPSMLALERACPTAGHWPESQYKLAIQPGDQHRFVVVAEGASSAETGGDSGILGFLVARHLAPEWELENIVVAPAARRNGLGKQLLDALLAQSRETDSESVFLEVRESNATARKLYQRAGFEPAARRKGYYTNPPEDAILYRLQLVPSEWKMPL